MDLYKYLGGYKFEKVKEPEGIAIVDATPPQPPKPKQKFDVTCEGKLIGYIKASYENSDIFIFVATPCFNENYGYPVRDLDHEFTQEEMEVILQKLKELNNYG